jgi:hypothetical protein
MSISEANFVERWVDVLRLCNLNGSESVVVLIKPESLSLLKIPSAAENLALWRNGVRSMDA